MILWRSSAGVHCVGAPSAPLAGGSPFAHDERRRCSQRRACFATVAIMCSPSTTSLLALRFDYDRRRQAGGLGTTSPLCTNTDQLTDPANVPASGGDGQG